MADESKFSQLGASNADLTAAWQDRLEDAKVLLAGGRHAAAIAAGIYAVEILLKSRICRTLKLSHMPKVFEIHDLWGLATSAGLRQAIEDPAFKASTVYQNWTKVRRDANKVNDLRYSPNANWSKQDATDFLHRLTDPTDGVMSWIQNQP